MLFVRSLVDALYFWIAIAVIGFALGLLARSKGTSRASESRGWRRVLRAIGSPVEFVLAAPLLYFLWEWGAFSGGKESFLLGVLAMIVVPVVIVFLVSRAFGSAAKREKWKDKD